MYSMIHNEVPNINFIISVNTLATSQIFLHSSTMYYFYFVITSKNNYVVNATSIEYGHYLVYQPTVLN